jgi:hypothetical protein
VGTVPKSKNVSNAKSYNGIPEVIDALRRRSTDEPKDV